MVFNTKNKKVSLPHLWRKADSCFLFQNLFIKGNSYCFYVLMYIANTLIIKSGLFVLNIVEILYTAFLYYHPRINLINFIK